MRLILICFSLLLAVTAYVPAGAQSLSTDDGVLHWEGGFDAGLNNDGWEFGFSAAWFPIQYVGAKISLGFANEIEQFSDWFADYEERENDYTARFRFNPAVVLRTPRIIKWKSQDGGFYLFAEPGMWLSPGASGSHDARIAGWNVKCGINAQIDRFIVTLGYGISDFSLYSGCPYSFQGYDPSHTNYITHTVFLAGSVKF